MATRTTRESLGLVVGDEDEGCAGLLVQAPDLGLHHLAQGLSSAEKRLVEQQHSPASTQRPRQGDAAAAGRRRAGRAAWAMAGEADALDHLATRRRTSPAGRPAHLQGEAMLASTLMCGNRHSPWNTMP